MALKAEIEAENKMLANKNKELQNSNKKLEKKFSELEAMVNNLMKSKENVVSEVKEVVSENVATESIVPIEQNKYIRVTSLCNGKLNLTPQTHGKGNPIVFHNFGQTRNITFQVLEEIVGANRKMAENGRYYIQDENAVKLLMLDDVYENILDEKKINTILSNKGNNVLELFKLTPPKQQDHVVSMIIKRVLNGGNIDYNQINAISEIYGKDLIMKINEAKKNKQTE